MEKVYLVDDKYPPNKFSDIINFKEYFQKFSTLVRTINTSRRLSFLVEEQIGLNRKQYDELNKKICCTRFRCKNTSNILIPEEGFKHHFQLYNIPENPKLKSLKILKGRTDKDLSYVKSRIQYHAEWDTEDIDTKTGIKAQILLTPFVDYLITARIYMLNVDPKFMPWKCTPLTVSHELIITSSTTLDLFKDRIACQSDFQPMKYDISNDPLVDVEYLSKDICKSGLFYIGNTLYVDCRFKNNVDYSEPIIEWGERKDLDLCYVEPMEMTTVDQLEFRLGYPYLYMHQGDCEHLIIFTDARLLSPRDDHALLHYPILKSFSNLKGTHCMTCGSRVAKYIVVESPRLPCDYTYMCTLCMFSYNYSDEKIGEFKLYRYVDRTAIF